MVRRDVVIEEDYPYSPDVMWAALTDPAALNEWLMENDFQPYVGHRFTFRTAPAPGFDGIVRCEVTVVDKPNRLVYTWQGGPMKQPTTVTWTLTPIAEGTRLRLAHTGFEGIVGVGLSVLLGSGWRRMLAKRLQVAIERSLSTGEHDD